MTRRQYVKALLLAVLLAAWTALVGWTAGATGLGCCVASVQLGLCVWTAKAIRMTEAPPT